MSTLKLRRKSQLERRIISATALRFEVGVEVETRIFCSAEPPVPSPLPVLWVRFLVPCLVLT